MPGCTLKRQVNAGEQHQSPEREGRRLGFTRLKQF